MARPDPPEDVPVEEDQGCHGNDPCGDQPGPVDVEPDVVGVGAELGGTEGDDDLRGVGLGGLQKLRGERAKNNACSLIRDVPAKLL